MTIEWPCNLTILYLIFFISGIKIISSWLVWINELVQVKHLKLCMEYSECLVNVTFHFFVQYFLLLIIVFPISTKSFPKTIHVKGLVKDFLPCKQRMLTESCILLIYQLMDSARLTAYHKPLHTKVTHLTFLLKP